jgi:hypothetical protein
MISESVSSMAGRRASSLTPNRRVHFAGDSSNDTPDDPEAVDAHDAPDNPEPVEERDTSDYAPTVEEQDASDDA